MKITPFFAFSCLVAPFVSQAAITPVGTPLECQATLKFSNGTVVTSSVAKTQVLDPNQSADPMKPNAEMEFPDLGLDVATCVYLETSDEGAADFGVSWKNKIFMKSELWKLDDVGGKLQAFSGAHFDDLETSRWMFFGQEARRPAENRDNDYATGFVKCWKSAKAE